MVEQLIDKQQQLLRSLDRALENFRKIGRNNYTPAKIRNRITALKEIWAQIQDGHVTLRSNIPAANQQSLSYFKDKLYEKAEDVYLTTSDHMAECLEELHPYVSSNQSGDQGRSSSGSSAAFSLTHLPPIKLPPFDGKFEEWESFRDRFTSLIISNKDLSDFSRMYFLTSCLKDRAFECVKNIPVTGDNFVVAWEMLKSRYESKRRLINVHLLTLLNLPVVPRESVQDLQSIRDKVNTAVAALNNLGREPEELWNDMLVCLITQKLDSVTRKAWNLKFGEENIPPSYDALRKFLDTRIRALEDSKLPTPLSDKESKSANAKTISSSTASASSQLKCSLCKAKHYFQACTQFTSKSPNQRRELVKQEKRCFNCLSKNHAVHACTSKHTCRRCHKRHHTMLHEDPDSSLKVEEVTTPSSPSTSSESKPNEVKAMFASSDAKLRSHVLLATAWVNVSTSFGRSVCVRALLDQGSEMTFITERLAQDLKLKRFRTSISISAVGGVTVGTSRHAARITISPRHASAPAFATTALILKSLTAYCPQRVPIDSAFDHLSDLSWADDDPMSYDPIDIIIGADLYSELILDGVRKSTVGRPIAQNSVLGWVISGPIASSLLSSHSTSVGSVPDQPSIHIRSHHCLNSSSLEQELRRFWEVEEIPRLTLLSPDDEKCEEHFRVTHSRDQDGRYIVRLPFKQGPPINIGKSRVIAEKFLTSLTRRFKANPEYAQEYSDFLQEYEFLGHMREMPASNLSDDQCVFIPHHPVIRESSATTRLRVVFNASSITSNGSSLNDHLLAGPKLQTELPAVILQWRKFKYVYTADITKMYRQIRVDSRDTNYQRILWNSNSTDTPREFQLLTVTYGTASAPFLALRVIKQLIIDEGHDFPLAVPVLKHQIYVDDVLFGDDDTDHLIQTRDQINSLLKRGGFELRKWASNSSILLADITSEKHGLACSKSLQSDEKLKVLGISWNPSQDIFQYQVKLEVEIPRSKRLILSTIAKLFDPLGWVTPVTIAAKVLMQTLWHLKLDWDDEIPLDTFARWRAIYDQMSALNEINLSRWTGHGSDTAQCELHGFADASSVAYAAAVYLRVVSESGHVTTTLLAGKSKVAPVKFMSIPRLELSAAVLLARLVEFVRKTVNINVDVCRCWTDSTVVLAWLKQHPSTWNTFIANRTSEIHSRLPSTPWSHIPTNDNPADSASRGLLGKELLKHELWWKGPTWLKLSRESWPKDNSGAPADSLLEKRRTTVLNTQQKTPWDLASRFSTWPKLIRVTAYILKFVDRCRHLNGDSQGSGSIDAAISAREYRSSRTFWLKTIQRELFSKEITALLDNKSISKKSSILSLNPFLDQEGLLRVGGRLRNVSRPFGVKHPIVLASHPLVTLIIKQAHLRALHAGVQLTLTTLRQEFWILRARSVVRGIIHKCVACVRESAAVPQQLMGNLPAQRVSKPSRCFLHCGLDYAGPVHIRASGGRGVKSRKAYIALFICLATRAIHLELVGNYSTSAFLDAFSRFCARRGLPESMHSDNGTTFVGADKDLASAYRAALNDKDFLNSTAVDNVTWHFIPPSAPHFGGLWEAGVRSVKHHLRRVLKNNMLTFEEFTTLLCRIEACLNSRPLAPLTDSPDDYEVLTPGHFLIGSSLTVHPEPSLLQINENRLSRWQRVRQLTEQFWKLWKNDYVNTLQQRVKWRKTHPSLKIGQLVLLRNDTLPPCKWELGRVIQCHDGSDGLTRVVTVKTSSSEYKRPIVKLCLLPIDCEDQSPCLPGE